MNLPAHRVRRAVIDDRPALHALWEAMHIPLGDLERRLTEFQVVESEGGHLLGALAMEIQGRQGRLHSETFSDFGLSAGLRERLWERMQSLAANHGLARIWTIETAPFWKQVGFRAADAAATKRFPESWAAIVPGLGAEWITMQLRNEEALQASLDRDFDALKREAASDSEKTKRVARFWKYFATGLAIVVAITVVMFCISLLKNKTSLPGH